MVRQPRHVTSTQAIFKALIDICLCAVHFELHPQPVVVLSQAFHEDVVFSVVAVLHKRAQQVSRAVGAVRLKQGTKLGYSNSQNTGCYNLYCYFSSSCLTT